MDALEFLKAQTDASADGIIYDPPYSPRQVKECYTAIGIKPDFDMFNSGYNSEVKKQISRIVKPGGKVLCFGWNSNGIGKGLGFELYRVLLVPHGSSHNDTICTAERRLNGALSEHF